MRYWIAMGLGILILALGFCTFIAIRSRRPDGERVSALLLSLVFPLFGNLFIVVSSDMSLSYMGYYFYLLGMDLVTLTLLRFTIPFCRMEEPEAWVRWTVHGLLILDAVQLLLNPWIHHAFSLQGILMEKRLYYQLLPHLGHTFHRVLVYCILAVVIVLFLVQIFRSSRLNARRYLVIFITMMAVGIWEALFASSRSSTLGLGLFGLMVFWLALYYRPVRLLDRLLATIASELPEALFFFDAGDRCIWVNPAGMRLAGVEEGSFEQATAWLTRTYGPPEKKGEGWISQRILGEGEDTKCYILEKRVLLDSKDRAIGSFLRIRDNTVEQRTLQKEIYNATHDSLTGVYNRAGYNLLLSNLDLNTTFMLLIDGDEFKSINDTYGHETGDRILQKVADRVKNNFRPGDYVCRVGGDEFIVLVLHAGPGQGRFIGERIQRINRELGDTSDGLPPTSISVGIAHGSDASGTKQLFSHADRALYETKDKGKGSYSFYTPKD